jgi:hypothetical protein
MSRIALDITPGQELHEILGMTVMSTTGLSPTRLQPREPPQRPNAAPPEPVQRRPAQHQPPPATGLTQTTRSRSPPKRQRQGQEANLADGATQHEQTEQPGDMMDTRNLQGFTVTGGNDTPPRRIEDGAAQDVTP